MEIRSAVTELSSNVPTNYGIYIISRIIIIIMTAIIIVILLMHTILIIIHPSTFVVRSFK